MATHTNWGREESQLILSNDNATSAMSGGRAESQINPYVVIYARCAVVQVRFLFGARITDLKERSAWRRGDVLSRVQF